ncbi:amidase [Natronocella acetinitrilica]|uniref:Amidase n=1 Tax=Natronocella acetinitrilica TaxID=414046 RepID=A0AAE3KHW8_9GAMM|nr:amidase [Natronocella acetinitrilica]MCP1676777.1 amidase [Natronocella acetinitrilica]
MSVKPPGPSTLKAISDEYGFDLSPQELVEYEAAVAAGLGIYARIDEYADELLPVKYPRASVGYRPVGEENPNNGWAWKCSIPGADSGPLAGCTVGIKDNVLVAGIPMLNGSPILEGYVPREDATVVTRLLDAGAHIIGKTAVPAFCFDGGGCTGYPEPQPENPHNPDHMAGSSSNGSAVVVVTGEVDMALGGDQGGSIRMPSSWSGCYGLKPTKGLVPYTGIFPIERTLDHTGPMARSAEDCARMLQVIAGPDGLDPRQYDVRTDDYLTSLGDSLSGLRVGLLREGFAIPDMSEADVDDGVRQAASVLEKAGASVSEVSVPMHADGLVLWVAIANEGATELMVWGDAYGTNARGHYSTDLIDFFGRARRARGRDFSQTVKATVLAGHYMSTCYNRHYYAKAQNLGRRLQAGYDEALRDVDLLVLPTTPMKAMRKPADRSLPTIMASALGNLYNTAPFDVTGHPAMSVPAGMSDGLPIGMMLIGRHWEDATVLRAAHAFQMKAS